MNTNGKRVLFVTTNEYPDWGIGANLFKRILFDGGLANHLLRVEVLTRKHDIDDKNFEIVDGVKIHRLDSGFFDNKWVLLKNVFNSPIRFCNGVILKIVSKLQKDNFYNKTYDCLICRTLKRLQAKHFDCIVVVSCDVTPAVAVLEYAKKTGVKFIYWQVDPRVANIIENPRTLSDRIIFEQEIVEQASATLMAPFVYEAEKKAGVKYNDKVIQMELPLVIPRHQAQLRQHTDGPIKCVFAGTIYGGIRDPKYTVRLFEELDRKDIELHLVGVTEEQIPECNAICHGVVPLDESLKAVDDADILINIGNLMTNQVPSKIFEYISTGKPIVNICKNRNCPTLPYLEKYPLALNLFEEEELFDKQVTMLKNFIVENCNKRVDLGKIKELYRECTPEYCAEVMLKEINK